jgi:Cu(I)/Ag(I) efflux system membrane fusion protein
VIDEDLAGKWISPMHPEVVKSGPGSCDVCGMPLVPAESLGYASRTVTNADAPLVIPATAPLQTGKRAVVYIEIANDDGPLFEGRQIELGPRAGDFYVVKSGLEEGDMVVTNGAFRIDSELQIQAKPSMMSPDGGAPAPGHQHGGNATVEMPEMTMTRVDANDDVTEALKPVYEAYFLVQMALAGDDHNAAAEASRKLETAIAAVDMNLFSQDGHERWMMIHSTLTQSAGVIAASSDIEAARTGFFELSSAAIDMQESFGHSGAEPYYLTYCPMAFDNTGAHWLQQEDIVWNSFYGAAMLRCGEIKKPLSARSSEGAN